MTLPLDLPSGEVPVSTPMLVDPAPPWSVHPAPPKPEPLQDPYLSLLTADLTQPQGPLLAGGSLDPALGADFLQERGRVSVSVWAAFS